jgi:hypothetical protein
MIIVKGNKLLRSLKTVESRVFLIFYWFMEGSGSGYESVQKSIRIRETPQNLRILIRILNSGP